MNQTYVQILYFAAGIALVIMGLRRLGSRSLSRSLPAWLVIALGLFVVVTSAYALKRLL